MTSQYPRGSEWRKWDLHVHTPLSLVNGYGGDEEAAWESFLSDLEALPPEFKAIGVNDYLFLDGYVRLRNEKYNNDRLKNIDLLLPVIEFRIKQFAGLEFKDTKRINLHVIFSDQLAPEIIQAQFLDPLQSAYELSPVSADKGITWSGHITRESLADFGKKIKESVPEDKKAQFKSDLMEGFNNLNIDEETIFSKLEGNTYLVGRALTALGKTEWNALKWGDGTIGEKKNIINKVNLVFVAAKSPEAACLARDALASQGVNSVLLDCSDAHYLSSESKVHERIGHCFTWIKADPTFEGLRQIVFEPDERIRIQASSPALDFKKSCFRAIRLAGSIFPGDEVEFDRQEIPLNRDLVTLIGGRGDGKSVLLDCLAKTFENYGIANQRENPVSPEEFVVTHQTEPDSNYEFVLGGGHNDLDYLHVRQGELRSITDPSQKGRLSAEIRQLLRIRQVEEESESPEALIQISLEEIRRHYAWFGEIDEEGNLVNSIEFNQRLKDRNESLIKTITTDENRALIEQYQANAKSGRQLTLLSEKLVSLKALLDRLCAQINVAIDEVNQLGVSSLVGESIPRVDTLLQSQKVEFAEKEISERQRSLAAENLRISREFEQQGVSQDIFGIREKVSAFQRSAEQADEKLKEHQRKTAGLSEAIERLTNLVNSVFEGLSKHADDVQQQFDSLKQGQAEWTQEQRALVSDLLSDIEIGGEIVFDKEEFYSILDGLLNGQRIKSRQSEYRVDRLIRLFHVRTFEDYFKLARNLPIITLDEESPAITLEQFSRMTEYFLRADFDILEAIYSQPYRSRYLKAVPKIEYRGRPPDKLSAGQKGTFYLCMKLATDPFGSPFVFDQPEDDLDNEFIMSNLVPLFKKIKKYRQVIIATHNANLVVNADAEQVIVAKNVSDVLEYESGALENTQPESEDGIREKVCQILEGGAKAFKKRERKYRIP